MAKKAAKRARLSDETQRIDDDSWCHEGGYGLTVSIEDIEMGLTLRTNIPWPMLIASVRRYNAVQRQKRQAKRASK